MQTDSITNDFIGHITEHFERANIVVLINYFDGKGNVVKNMRWHGDLYSCYGMVKALTVAMEENFKTFKES
jgi:hypothetical protein